MHNPSPIARALLRRPRHRMRLRLLERRQLEIIPQLELSLRVALPREEVDDEGVFDGEDGIVSEVLVTAVEDLRDDGFVGRGGDLISFDWSVELERVLGAGIGAKIQRKRECVR